MKAKIVVDAQGLFHGIRFDCPACGTIVLPVSWLPEGQTRSPHVTAAGWGFNGNMDAPTFSPSVLSQREVGEQRIKEVCHSFVTDGRIQFLGDCTHALANQTVDLPELE